MLTGVETYPPNMLGGWRLKTPFLSSWRQWLEKALYHLR